MGGDHTAMDMLALVDRKRPDMLVPVFSEDGKLGAMAKGIYGLGSCLCASIAGLPFLAVAILKLRQPLVEDPYVPIALQGYNSSATKSRFLPSPEGRWTLDQLRVAAMAGIVATLCFWASVALPWWLLYVRRSLDQVTASYSDAEDSQDSDANTVEYTGESTPLLCE